MSFLSDTRLLWFVLATASLLGIVGCGSSSGTTAPGTMPSTFPNHSADQIRAFIQQPTDTLQRFAADARVTVQSPQQNRSFNADIRQQRADSLFMRFSLFGMEGGRMLLTPDSAFVYNKRDQTLRVGPIADARKFLPAPVASNQVFANMLGLVAPDDHTEWTVEADSARYHLTDPSGRRHWIVDPSRWRVVRYTEEAADGSVIEQRRFSNFRMIGGIVLPYKVVFRRPADKLMARIEYEDIRLNPSGLSYELGAPTQLPRKPLSRQ